MSTDATAATLRHEALLYPTTEALLDTVIPFVQDGLARREPVLIAVPECRYKLIADALGEAHRQVEFVELGRVSRNPNLILPTVLRPFLDRYPNQPTRIVAEQVWPGRFPAEATQVIRCEAVTNWLLADRPTTLLCLYDADQLDANLLGLAGRTHPFVVEGGERHRCELYAPAERVLDNLNDPVPDTSPASVDVALARYQVTEVRDLIAGYGGRLGLADERVADLLRALDEVAEPTLRQYPHTGRLRVTDDPDRLLCEIRTPGTGYDPIAGLRPTEADSPFGHGVLAANRLCDLSETHLHTRARPETAALYLVMWP